jgi:hypothetical protein
MSGRTCRGKFRYYRCASWANVADPSTRCYGEPRVDEVETKVREAIVRVLEQPKLIAAEVPVSRKQPMTSGRSFSRSSR